MDSVQRGPRGTERIILGVKTYETKLSRGGEGGDEDPVLRLSRRKKTFLFL